METASHRPPSAGLGSRKKKKRKAQRCSTSNRRLRNLEWNELYDGTIILAIFFFFFLSLFLYLSRSRDKEKVCSIHDGQRIRVSPRFFRVSPCNYYPYTRYTLLYI